MSEDSAPKRARGRPGDFVQRFFDKTVEDLKAKRWGKRCRACQQEWTGAAAHKMTLEQHITLHCPMTTQIDKMQMVAKVASRGASGDEGEEDDVPITAGTSSGGAAAAPGGGPKAGAAKKQSGSKPPASRLMTQFTTRVMGPEEQRRAHQKLTRFLVMKGLPLNTVEDPYFLDLLHYLQPSYVPCGRGKVSNELMLEEYSRAMKGMYDLLSKEELLGVCQDGWTNCKKESVYATTVVVGGAERSTYLLSTQDLSAESHTAEKLAELLKEHINNIGALRVAYLVTDNAAACKLARAIVVATEGFKHIIEMRCHLHAFNLGMTSAMAHAFFKAIITDAQKIVTFFRASHLPYSLLRKFAESLGCLVRALRSSNMTRFTSVAMCLRSVLDLLPYLKLVVEHHPQLFTSASGKAVAVVIKSEAFAKDLPIACEVLAPWEEVIMAIQRDTATLADVTRYWAYLCACMGRVSAKVPADVGKHLVAAFNIRVKEMNTMICRLALFLHPCYKGHANYNNDLEPLKAMAAELCKQRSLPEEDVEKLSELIDLYAQGQPPFDRRCASTALVDVLAYWRTKPPTARPLAYLAILLLSMPPHAAAVERVFSAMGWFHTAVRNRLSVAMVGMMVAIRLWLLQQQPSGPPAIAELRQQQQVQRAAAVQQAAAKRLSPAPPALPHGQPITPPLPPQPQRLLQTPPVWQPSFGVQPQQQPGYGQPQPGGAYSGAYGGQPLQQPMYGQQQQQPMYGQQQQQPMYGQQQQPMYGQQLQPVYGQQQQQPMYGQQQPGYGQMQQQPMYGQQQQNPGPSRTVATPPPIGGSEDTSDTDGGAVGGDDAEAATAEELGSFLTEAFEEVEGDLLTEIAGIGVLHALESATAMCAAQAAATVTGVVPTVEEKAVAERVSLQNALGSALRESFAWFDFTQDPMQPNYGQAVMSMALGGGMRPQ